MTGKEGVHGLFAGREGSPSSLVGRGAQRRPRAADGGVDLAAAPVWADRRHQNGVNGVSLVEDVWQQAGAGAAPARELQSWLVLTVGDDQCIKVLRVGLGINHEGALVVNAGREHEPPSAPRGDGSLETCAQGVHGSTIRGVFLPLPRIIPRAIRC
jgi:hypothetical protein